MAKPGPKKTPKAILKLRGSWRGNLPEVELQGKYKPPRRPKWLKGEAKSLWERLVPQLHREGLCTDLNREAMVLLCCAWEDFCEARNQLAKIRNKDGSRALLIKTAKGGGTENPLLYTQKRAFDQVLKAAACFGLTPSDLAGVQTVDKPEKKDAKAKFFKGA